VTEGAKSAAADVFAKPLVELAKPAVPEAVAAPQPVPPPPAVSDIAASLSASLTANGGVDADIDGKVDPGVDTIAYTLTLTSSGAGGTGLSIANPLDAHTTIVSSSLNSTPVAFDQSVSLNEDATLVITLQGQDPDGSNLTFKKSDGTAFPGNPTTIATAHGTIGNFQSVSCNANGVCSQQVTYTPALNYNGPDSFGFKANDITANSNENGAVTITVIAVNDAPTFTTPGNPGSVTEDAGLTTVTDFISEVRPAQGLPTPNTTEDSQTVSFVITNITHSALFTAGGQPVLTVQGAGVAPFPRKANLTYTPAPNANGTSIVTYHLHDTGGTSPGVDNSADQTFTITVTAINDPPVVDPAAKAFTVQANMRSVGFTGLLANATDPDATNANADGFSADKAAGYLSPTFTLASLTGACTSIVANPATGAGPCTIAITSTSTGTFNFDPPPGVTGAVTLNYTISDNGNPGSATSLAGTINITVNGPVIWFVDPTRTNNGNGTLSGAADAAGNPGPFKSLTSANNAINLKTGQRVFVYTGTTPAGEALDLSGNNNWLVGQGTVATNFDTFFGLTGGASPPAATVGRPTLNNVASTAFAARPQISGTVTMRNNTQVTGVKIVTTGATAGLKSTGFTSGTSLVKDVSVTTATGSAVDFSGVQTLTYETSDGTNSPNVLLSTSGTALRVDTTTIGANGFTFKSITTTGAPNGIFLKDTGTIGFLNVTGDGSDTSQGGNDSGGTISTNGTDNTTNGIGVYLNNVKNITLRRMHLQNNQNYGIFGSGVTQFKFEYSKIDGTNGSNVLADGEDSIQIQGLFGTAATDNSLKNDIIKGGWRDNVHIRNITATNASINTPDKLTITGSLIRDTNTGSNGNDNVLIRTDGTGNLKADVTSNTFAATNGDHIQTVGDEQSKLQIVITNNAFSGGGGASMLGQGITISGGTATPLDSTETVRFNISNNGTAGSPMTGTKQGGAININQGSGNGNWQGQISNNFVGNAAVQCSGASESSGIRLENHSKGTLTGIVANNTIRQACGAGGGISLSAGDNTASGLGNGPLNATVTGNSVILPAGLAAPFNDDHGITMIGGNLSGNTNAVCVDFQNNASTGNTAAGTSGQGYRIRQRFQATVSMPGYGGPAQGFPAAPNAVRTYILGRPNTGNGDPTSANNGDVSVTVQTVAPLGGGFINTPGGGQCAQPTVPVVGALFNQKSGDQQFARAGSLLENIGTVSLLALLNSQSDFGRLAEPRVSPDRSTQATPQPIPFGTVTAEAKVGPSTVAKVSAADSLTAFARTTLSMIEPTAHAEKIRKPEAGSQQSASGNLNSTDRFAATDNLAATQRQIEASMSGVGTQISNVRLDHAAKAEIRGLKAGVSQESGDRRSNHAASAEIRGQRLDVRNHATTAAPLVPTPVGSFPINGTGLGAGFQLPAGKTITISFKATLNTPPALSGPVNPKVTAQATLTGSFVGNPLLSDDPAPAGTTDPTVTNADLYDSTTTLSASPSSSTNTGQAVTFTATIGTSGTPSGSAFNRSGTVNFRDNGATIGCDSQSVSHVGSNDVATCTTSSLTTASHTNITAAYSGDGSFDPSTSSAFTQTVSKSGTNATLTSSLNPSTVTQSVTFTATITTATSVPNPGGTVNFKEGLTTLCANVALNGSGVATCPISSLTTGNHPITADYSGDTNFNANAGILLSGGSPINNQTVSKATPTVTLVSSVNPSFVSQPVTFMATVAAPGGISATPTGTLTFKDGVTTIGCSNAGGQALSGGTATCQTSLLSFGSHTITVDYPNTDPNFNPVTGTGMTAVGPGQNGNPQVVNQSNTTMTVTSSPVSPTLVSQPVTFTVKIVSSNGSVTAAPTGTVRFFDGASGVNQIGSDVTLTPGAGGACPVGTSCADSAAISTLTAGSHTITVDYLADSNYTAHSTNILLVVNKSDTTTTLTANPPVQQPVSGANVDFTAHVISTGVSFASNTAKVQFKDGASTIAGCGAVTINGSGDAVCTTTLPDGTHSISAVYPGDATFNTSSGSIASYHFGPSCANPATVMNADDTGGGSLRDAIAQVCDGGTINFNAVAFASLQTITLSSVLQISKNVTITGPGTTKVSIDAAGATQIFKINGGFTVNMSAMALNNGKITGLNGAPGVSGANVNGGGIDNAGTLTLTNMIVNNSEARGGNGGDGGASAGGNGGNGLGGNIYNSNTGSLTITNSTISSGKATGGSGGSSTTATNGNGGVGFGGGIYNLGTLNITNSTIGDSNAANGGAAGAGAGTAGTAGDGSGGGIFNQGTFGGVVLNISNSTISGNTAGANGGGVANIGAATNAPMSITNTTISGNSANNDGGGIYQAAGSAPSTLTSVTVTNNRADNDSSLVGEGGGIRVVSGPVTLQDTIVAANYQASLQVESATVTGGPVNAGQNQVETLTVVVTAPPITTVGTATLKVTINGTTLADKTINLGTPIPDTAATIADKIRDLLNGDGTVHGPFTATSSGADVTLTANSPAQNDGSLLVQVIGCGLSACTGLNNSDSVDTLTGIAPAGTNQVETLTVLSSPSGCGGPTGTVSVVVIANGLAQSGIPFPVTVNQSDSPAQVADTIKTFLAGGGPPDLTGFFTITGSSADVVFTKNAPETNDTTMNVAVLNGTCTVVTASANTTAGVAPPGVKQVETLTVTGAIDSGGAGNATVHVRIDSADLIPDFTVPLANDDTAALVAGKIRDAIDVSPISDSYVVSVGTGVNDADVILTAKTEAANNTFLKVSILICGCTGLTGLPNHSADTVPGQAPTKQVETMTVLNGPISGCPGGGPTGDVTVLVIADGMSGTGTPFTVPVNKLDTADTVAGKVRDFINNISNMGMAANVRGYFDITASGADVIFTRKLYAADDPNMAMSVTNGTCSGINSLSADTTTTGRNQIETVTVSINTSISTNATATIKVKINGGFLPDKTISLVKNETAAQVAIDIKNLLNLDGTIHGPFTADVGAGPNAADVILTRNSPAADDDSLLVQIIGCGASCPGLNSSDSGNTFPGIAQDVKVTITAQPSYFGASLLPVPGTKDILVTVATGNTAAQVAAKVANALNADSDVSLVFLASSTSATVRLTRKIVAADDISLTISIDNAPGSNTGITLSTPQPSDDTRKGGGSAKHDDISGAIDSSSTFNLVGVDTGITVGSITDGNGGNQIGTVASPIDPRLGPLAKANIADPTKTHALLDTPVISPAIDKGKAFLLITDQRGVQRTVDLPLPTYPNASGGDGTDIGAFENQVPPATPGIALVVPGTTHDSTPDFSITNITVGATVDLMRAGVLNPVATVLAASTTVSLTDNTLTSDSPTGTPYAYSAKQTVNGASSTSVTLDVTVDTRPSIPDLLNLDDTVGAGTTGTNLDNITKITTPRFTGGAPTDPGVTVQLFVVGNSTPIASTTSDGSGNWTITTPVLAPGPYSFTAREVIGSFIGNQSTALTGVVIDTSTPASTPGLAPGDDSGLADNITKQNTPTFIGSGAEVGGSVQLLANGSPVGVPATVNGSGGWSIGPLAMLSDGTYLMTAVVTDLAGNTSTASLTVTIDITSAAPSTPDLFDGDDTGTFDNDNVTKKTQPTFKGTAEAGSTVHLFAGAVQVGTGVATGGNWSIAPTSALADGTYQITADATDTAGNTSSASGALNVTIDTTAPLKPSAKPDLIAADDTGVLPDDNITKTTKPTFIGANTVEASSIVDLFADNGLGGPPASVGTGSADGSGAWSILACTLPCNPFADGTYLFTVKATDLAGNQSVASDTLQVVIDTVPPPLPSTPVLNPADDTGILNTDKITKVNTPNFTGEAEADSIVQLFANNGGGATPVGSGPANGAPGSAGNKAWTIISGLLPDNSYSMTAQATDVAGNTSLPSGAFGPLVIDTVKPTVAMSSAVGNPTATTPIPVAVHFNEPVFGFTLGGIVPGPPAPPPPPFPPPPGATAGSFAGSGMDYTFNLTPGTAGGVFADIPAGGATDTAGNGNTAAVQFNRTYDPSALNATITAISPNPRNTAVSSIQIVFNKPVTGFDLGDLKLTRDGGATNLLTGAQILNSADNATWTLGNLAGITTAEGTYDLTLTAAGSGIQDSTSTALASGTTASWGMDTTKPTVTVEQAVGQTDPVTGPTGTTIINFTAKFNEPVTGFTASGVTVFGGANPTIVNVSGSGTTYNLAVQGMNQTGPVQASVNLDAAQDSAGNGNAVSTSADNTVQFNADNFTTLEVNTTADTDDGSCDPLGTGSGNKDCTLREAIKRANADFGAETITFNSTVFAAPATYTINLGSALPNITTDVTITGPGAKVLTVKRNAAAAFRIFRASNSAIVAISDLTMNNGNAGNGAGMVIGAFANDPVVVTLTRVEVTGNTATGADGGGGIFLGVGSTLNLIESTVSGNQSTSAVSGDGGGITNLDGNLFVTNSTISGNSANSRGGGIWAVSTTPLTITISNSTITSNSAVGGGGGVALRNPPVNATIRSNIIGGNTTGGTGPDVLTQNTATFQSDGFNLIESTSGATINLNPGAADITGVSPQLNPLADNGGPTKTHSLLCTSPAIDKGFKFTAATDQRGGTRPFDLADAVYPNAVGGDGSDIGAYETQSAGGCVPLAVPPSPAPSTNEDTPVTMTLTGTYSQNINLSFAITQNPAIGQLGAISAPNCVFNLSMTCKATVTYTPNLNANGNDLFKFKVSAGGLDSDPEDVNIGVNAINDPPIFLQAGPQTVLEDAGPQQADNFITIFSAGPANESGQAVQFIVTGNTNPGLFSAAPAIDGAGALTYTSAANANGSATITIVAKDNGGGADTSAPQSFTITVVSVNDAPSFSLSADPTVLEDAGPQTQASFATAISVGPAQESAQTAQFIITGNTNPGLFVSAPAISPTGTLTYSPATDANGSATITVVLKDNGGTASGGQDTSAPQTFTINVTPVNDQPTLNSISNLIIDEDAATQTVNLSGIGAGGGETQMLGITVTSSNQLLIPNPIVITYTSPNATGSISFKPAPDQNGLATITVTAKDSGGTANGGVDMVVTTFVVQVNPVNDAPINVVPGPQTVAENSPLVFALSNSNAILITDVDAGGSQMKVTLTATNGLLTLANTANLAFSVGDGTADPTMTFAGSLTDVNTAIQSGLTFAPPNGFSGAASLQIITSDQGNTGSGGPLTDTDTVSITVSDGGTLQFSAATFAVSENNGPALITVTRTGGSAGTATVQIATSNGTATAGSDYTAVSQTVTFGNGETSKTVSIPITDELINEPDETVNLTLSSAGGSGALGTPVTAVLTITNDDPTGGYIKFSAPSYSVAEGGVATITVQRVGTLTQAVSVEFATSDNSDPAMMVLCAPTPGNTIASSRCDFNSTFGRLTWAAGDGADKTFKVMTTQDNYVEGPEALTLTLSNLSPAAAFSGPSTETLTITDDAVEPATNPTDDSDAYVEQLYRDFLNRPSDPSGKAFWVNVINHCNDPAQRPAGQTAAQCIQIARVVTGGAFFLSNEFQATGGAAYLTSKAAFGGLPNFARFERDAQQIGQGYVFGAPGAEALLEANKAAYFNDYVTRTDFVNTYGGVSDQQYVNTLISNTGVTFTQQERDALANGLTNQTETRATVLRKITEKPAFKTAEFNSMFVLMEYFGFLRRNPDQAGFAFWLNKLNQANGDYFAAEMVKAFIESNEYRQRFGQ
jgi:CSLREA domain-containing protein